MRLAVHFQMLEGQVMAQVRDSAMAYVKVMDPPEQNPFPGKRVIGRTYMPDGESSALVNQGAAGAQIWFGRFLPFYKKCSYVWAWEGPNEPQPMSEASFRHQLDDFTFALVNLMHGEGLRLVGHNWSVGNPPDVATASEMGRSIQACDYWGLHEYSAPAMWDGAGWYCLRYRKFAQDVQKAGFVIPPILITETGIDGGVLTPPGWYTAWKQYATLGEYETQLAWYDQELTNDGVVAAFIFTAGPTPEWRNFEVTPALGHWLMEKSWIPEHTTAPSEIAPVNPPVVGPAPALVNLVGKLPMHATNAPEIRKGVPTGIVVHHSGANHKYDDERAVKSIAAYHVRRWNWPTIAYTWVISRAGVIYQCLPQSTIGHHSGKASVNRSDVAVCLLGNYAKVSPPEAQVVALRRLAHWLGLPVRGHNEIVKTVCPGPWFKDFAAGG